jgi:hypothetical protein
MSRASTIEHVRRVNAAIELLKERNSSRAALSELCVRFNLSLRQAYRYLREAEAAVGPLAIPEAKAVFSVKLPESLIVRVRQTARVQKQTFSDLVAGALETALSKPKPVSHG